MSRLCSVCFTSSDEFPTIQFPNDFTVQIYELREEGLLPGINDLDPTQLHLCQACFDTVEDRIERKLRENKAKKQLSKRKSLSDAKFLPDVSVKTEPSTQKGEKQSQSDGTGNGETARPKTPALIDLVSSEEENENESADTEEGPGPSSRSRRPFRIPTAARNDQKCGGNRENKMSTRVSNARKRRKNATRTTSSGSEEETDLFTIVRRRVQRRSKRGKKATSERNVDVDPQVNGNTGNEVDEKMGVFLDWAETNGNVVHDSESSDEEQEQATNGNGENPRTNGIDNVPDNGVKVIPFIRHAYDLDQDQSSTAENKKIINMMFEYYNGQIKNFPNPATILTSSWMENTGPGRGFPKPSTLLTLNPTEDKKSGRSKRGWSQDQLLTTMKLDISQEQELALVLGFGTEITYEYLNARKKQQRFFEMKGEMLFNVPNNVPLFLTFSSGVISQLDDLGEAREMENSEFPLVSGFAIPKIGGMTIKTFEFTEEINLKYGKGAKVNSGNCAEILNISSEEINKVVAILVFFTEDYADKKKLVGSLTSALFHFIRKHPKVAVAGGLHYKNIVFQNDGLRKEENEPVAMGIVIIGDPSVVRAAAVNFPGPKRTEIEKIYSRKKPWEISDSLSQLEYMKKHCEFANGGSFAFQISCAGRGLRMHKTLHKEASLFKSIFPNTPLVGGFNGGEFIHEYKPWKPENQQCKMPNVETDLEPFYSTTFLSIFYA